MPSRIYFLPCWHSFSQPKSLRMMQVRRMMIAHELRYSVPPSFKIQTKSDMGWKWLKCYHLVIFGRLGWSLVS